MNKSVIVKYRERVLDVTVHARMQAEADDRLYAASCKPVENVENRMIKKSDGQKYSPIIGIHCYDLHVLLKRSHLFLTKYISFY